MHRLQEQIDRPTTKRNAAMTEVTTRSSAESRHDAHRDVRTRHLGDHPLTGASRGFVAGAPATMLFDPTRGREPQASMLLDPTRGRELQGSANVRFDPTRGREVQANVQLDPTRGREPQASLALDPTRGREVQGSVSVRFDPTRGRELHESSANLLFMPTHGHEDRAALAA